jgi:hypothetical protein
VVPAGLRGSSAGQALAELALAHGYHTAFWWTAGIFARGAVIVGALLRPGPLGKQGTPRHMPRRQPVKAKQTQPGVIPEHFHRQTRRVVEASKLEECCWRPAAKACPGGHQIPVMRDHLPARDHDVMDPRLPRT